MTAAARPHRPLLAYAAAFVALATLAACTGGDPGPADTTAPPASTSASSSSTPPTTTTSAAPSPTPSADPVIAKIPERARQHSQDGAEAFAQFYMEQVNRAFTTADPGALAGLSDQGCKTCAAFVNGARDLKQNGHHHKGLSISVDGSPANNYAASSATVQIFVTQHSVPVVDKDGKKVDQTKAGQGIFIATLSFKDHWLVNRLQVAK